MTETTSPPLDSSTVVLHGLGWEHSSAVVAALAACHPRSACDGVDLVLNRVLHGVTWSTYVKFLDALGEYPLRHAYDGWNLIMMSPRKDHDRTAHLIGRMIEQMTLELGLGIQSVGSMTISSPTVQRSVQPDQAYYITHELQVRGKSVFDPAVDPPPDLIVEVDVTSSSEFRMPVFAALKIPEVWRFDGQTMAFFRLHARGEYDRVDHSGEFPWLTTQNLLDHLLQQNSIPENQLILAFAQAMRAIIQ